MAIMSEPLQKPDHGVTHSTPADDVPRQLKRRLLVVFGAAVGIIALIYAAWVLLFAGHTVSTDNAYTAVEVAQITPLVGGSVVTVEVIDSQIVRAGDVLVRLDETDSLIAVDQ